MIQKVALIGALWASAPSAALGFVGSQSSLSHSTVSRGLGFAGARCPARSAAVSLRASGAADSNNAGDQGNK